MITTLTLIVAAALSCLAWGARRDADHLPGVAGVATRYASTAAAIVGVLLLAGTVSSFSIGLYAARGWLLIAAPTLGVLALVWGVARTVGERVELPVAAGVEEREAEAKGAR